MEKTGADGEKLTVTETVPTADMNYVADLLKEQGLIEYKFVFQIFAAVTHGRGSPPACWRPPGGGPPSGRRT